MQELDQALTAGIGVGFPKPANDVKHGCGRANPCVEVAKDNYLPLLLEPEVHPPYETADNRTDSMIIGIGAAHAGAPAVCYMGGVKAINQPE